MSIVILGDLFTFPDGNAATNRVYTYANGFIQNRISTHIICFRNDFHTIYHGETYEINYYYPFRQSQRNRYFLVRRWKKLFKYINTYRLINEINKNDHIEAIICYSNLLLTIFFSFFLSKTAKTILLLERSEHPLQYYSKNIIQKIQGEIRLFFEIKLCKSILCISQYLIDFYQKRGFDRKYLLHVPSTVDTKRFEIQFKNPLAFEYILYCGSLTILKDGVDILIKSFAQISLRYPELRLVLLGKGDTIEDEATIRNLVSELKMENKVIFLGQRSRNEIPPYLINAKILALARPASMIADAGFPSKVTEYLATGKPIAVTAVGEIPLFLHDGTNAFIALPGSIESFAVALKKILADYNRAIEIGEKGKELTLTIFNYIFQTQRIIGFIRSM